MDDLFLGLFRRRADQGLERQAQALASAQPLWALWELSRDPRGTALTMEFMALANHRKAIEPRSPSSPSATGPSCLAGIGGVFARYGVDTTGCRPSSATVLMTSIAQFLVIEEETLGMSSGHAETVAFVERFLSELEGPRRPST